MNIATRFLRGATLTLAGLSLGLGAVQVTGHGASADMWCWDDPVVQVNNMTAALNIGVAGSPDDVAATVKGVTITVYVPDVHQARVIDLPSGVLKERVQFVQADEADEVGDVHVAFQLASRKAPSRAALQVTANGVTTTVTGKPLRGLDAHFTVH